MMKRTQAMRKVIALLLGVIVCLPAVAHAEKERKSPLTDAPVIRKRLELRDRRFEFGIGAGVTIGQDFYNALLVMPKLSYHFTDWISLAVVGGFNVTPTWKSSFTNDISSGLANANTFNKSPNKDDALATMNHIGGLGLAQLEFIPLSGKIALLSSLFSYFDFYVLAGGGIVNLAAASGASNASCITTAPYCKAYTATEFAGNVGAGAHAFLTKWLAINLEIRDLIYKNNASGRDVNGDGTTNSRDLEWTSNYLFSLNFQFFAPFKAKISR
jgi:outer membrane beta-barrel protein